MQLFRVSCGSVGEAQPLKPSRAKHEDQELGHGQLVFPLFKGEFPFWLPYFTGYNIISQLFSIYLEFVLIIFSYSDRLC